jgi:hypothetical protein
MPEALQKYYVTFPFKYIELRNKYCVLEAYTKDDALEEAFLLFGTAWAFMYSEEEFKGQPEKYGLTEKTDFPYSLRTE